MSRLAGKAYCNAALPRDCGNDAKRQVLGLEHRSLLDVNFAVTEKIAGKPPLSLKSIRIASKCLNGTGHRDPVSVFQCQEDRVEASCHDSTSEIGRVVTETFFVGKPNDLDAKRQELLSGVQALNAGQRDKHSKHAIILSGITHRIEMRTEN